MRKFVSIIIPTYKDWGRLSLCLKALSEQTYASESFEIVVVNNCITDPPPVNYLIPKSCTIITEGKPGSYAARNAALQIIKGEIIGFTDSDCIPDKHWIANAVSHLEREPSIPRIGGPLEIFFQKSEPNLIELYDKKFAFPQRVYAAMGFAVTGNLFVTRRVLDMCGPFNDEVQSGGDLLWGKKAQDLGLPIAYHADVIVKHPARPTLRELYIKEKRVGKGKAVIVSGQNKSRTTYFLDFLRHCKPKKKVVKEIFQESDDMNLLQKLWLTNLYHFLFTVRSFYVLKQQIKGSRGKKL